MDKYLYWLDRIKGLGPVSKRNLMEAFGSAREVYLGKEKLIRYILDEKKWKLFETAKTEEPEQAFEQLMKQNIGMVAYGQNRYPGKLIHIQILLSVSIIKVNYRRKICLPWLLSVQESVLPMESTLPESWEKVWEAGGFR